MLSSDFTPLYRIPSLDYEDYLEVAKANRNSSEDTCCPCCCSCASIPQLSYGNLPIILEEDSYSYEEEVVDYHPASDGQSSSAASSSETEEQERSESSLLEAILRLREIIDRSGKQVEVNLSRKGLALAVV